ncbi:helix-turn-helix domain-containing protein [Rhizobium sp. ZW T2_16]|uniref:helix-turn-helix domain-containing protein n=1 Tax=Rhizobium sp. ZW T2_16 TaxID=3378083 RepID=UPI0038549FDE
MQKFPDAGLLFTSQARGWTGVAAEIRSHPAGRIPDICSSKTEITLALRGTLHGRVERRGNGNFQTAASRTGTVWFSPIGVLEDKIMISETIPEVLHIYLGDEQINAFSEVVARPILLDDRLYRSGLEDEFVRQVCIRIASELKSETAGGALLVEQLSTALIAHLCGRYHDDCHTASEHVSHATRLDNRRLRRVLDYVEANLDSDITISDIASIACLSRFHFSRAFKASVGESPSRYIGKRRLDRARELIENTEMALAEIAFACSFSSQQAFIRAFQRQFGETPGACRRPEFLNE